MEPIESAEQTHLNSIHVAEDCEESKRLRTLQDVKENFYLIKELNILQYNANTYTYVIPISQQFYNEINPVILNKSNNDEYKWLNDNHVSIGGISGFENSKPTLTINYDSDEDSTSFKSTSEIQQLLEDYQDNNWININDNTPLLGGDSLKKRTTYSFSLD